MTSQLLSRHNERDVQRPALPFLGDLSLTLARAHEICGNARRFLACVIAARLSGPVFWIAPSWQTDQLNPEAVGRLFDPGRITFLDPERAEDLLWCMEEVLRAGITPLVVADLPAPPGLTAVRRLHLAAETGAAEGRVRPLALLLTPGDGGAPGVETRWHIAGQHEATGPRRWQLERRRARTAPQKRWHMVPGGGQFRLEPLAE
jgi:protein ImuA